MIHACIIMHDACIIIIPSMISIIFSTATIINYRLDVWPLITRKRRLPFVTKALSNNSVAQMPRCRRDEANCLDRQKLSCHGRRSRVRRTPDSEQGPSLAEGSLRVHQLLVLPWHGFVYSAVRGRPRFTLEPPFLSDVCANVYYGGSRCLLSDY